MFSSSLDSDIKKDDNYYPHVFLRECKYIGKKVVRRFIADLDDSDDSDDDFDDPDEE